MDGQIVPIPCRQSLATTSTEQTAAAAGAGKEEDGGTAAGLCGGLWHRVRGLTGGGGETEAEVGKWRGREEVGR